MTGKAGISARLRQAVDSSGLKHHQIAGAAGISGNTLRSYMSYGTMPGASNLAALCQALHISADWLLGLDKGGCSGPDPARLN